MNFSYENVSFWERETTNLKWINLSEKKKKKRLGLVKTTGVQCQQVFTAVPFPPVKFVRFVLVVVW